MTTLEEDKKSTLDRVSTIKIQKNNTLINIKVDSSSNSNIKNEDTAITVKEISQDNNINNNTINRKDYYKNDIVKKGKKHKVTWADKAKKEPLTNIVKIDNFKNFNNTIQSTEPYKSSKSKDADSDDTVRCKCIIF